MKIKVCGLRSNPESTAVARINEVDYIGFIFAEQSPRFTEETIPTPGKQRVGVFVNAPLETILQAIQTHALSTVQLHGDESPEYCAALPEAITVMKAFGIADASDLQAIAAYESAIDYVLFDTKSPERGGSGKPFDWAILDQYEGTTPFFLSGGIGPESVPALRDFKHPRFYGIDLNSRFELQPGIKDAPLIQTFIQLLNT